MSPDGRESSDRVATHRDRAEIDFGDERQAVIIYAANMVGVTVTFVAQIVYAYRRDLMRPEARELERRFAGPANLVVAAVFAGQRAPRL